MRIELIENRGPNTLLATLRELLGRASTFDGQVAFVSAQGAGSLLPHLRKTALRGRVRLVTGFYQAITEPAALRLLLTAQQQTKGKLSVRIARDARFHRKLYVVRAGKRWTVISGSSNLSAEGLKSGGEFDLLVELDDRSKRQQRLASIFEQVWQSGSVPLTRDIIKRYEKARPPRPTRTFIGASLTKILGAPTSSGDVTHDDARNAAPKYWRDYISGFAPQRTEAVVHEETDWQRRGYWWFSSHTDAYERGDLVLLFDQSTGWARAAIVKDTTRTATPTPDGRHFVAYEHLRGWHRRRLNRKFWNRLSDAGLAITAGARTRRRRLTESQWSKLEAVFKR